jgi:phage terminase large subunit
MAVELQINVPAALKPLEEFDGRFFGAFGGRGSGKSHYFARRLIRRCVRDPSTRAVCLREIQASLRESVKALIEALIVRYRLQKYFDVQAALIKVLDPNSGLPKGIIIFSGLLNHTSDSIKSLEGYDIAWIEEAHSVSQRSWRLLRPTIRKPGSEIWCSWNPQSPKDPIDAFFRGPNPHPRAIVVQANYRQNPWLSQELKEEMEHDLKTDKDTYAHVWLGQYANMTSARVFKNFRVGTLEEFERIKRDRPYYGADWGFATDPTVLVESFIEGRNLYIARELHGLHIEVEDTPHFFAGLNDFHVNKLNKQALEGLKDKVRWEGIPGCQDWPICADSARPEIISYMKRHGFNHIKAAKKGVGSVEEGVKFLQGYNIIVHPDCVNTLDELTLYSYEIDKHTEEVLPKLADKDNHIIDALRYSVENLRLKGRVGVLF